MTYKQSHPEHIGLFTFAQIEYNLEVEIGLLFFKCPVIIGNFSAKLSAQHEREHSKIPDLLDKQHILSSAQMLKLGYATHCRIQTSLNSNFYFVGEEILLGLNIDNSTCSKNIEHYYWKIVRRVQCTGSFDKKYYKHQQAEMLTDGQKISGCNAKTSENITVKVALPVFDHFDTNRHPEKQSGSLTPSFSGKLFKITYEIVLLVKFEGVELRTQNSCVVPIIVHTHPDSLIKKIDTYPDQVVCPDIKPHFMGRRLFAIPNFIDESY